MSKKHSLTTAILVIVDVALFYAAMLGWLSFRYSAAPEGALLIQKHLVPFTVIFLSWLVSFGAFGLYDLKIMKNSKRFLFRLSRAMVTNAVLAIIILYFLLPAFAIEPRRNLLVIAALATVLIFVWRFLFNLVIIRTPASRVLFFGVTKEAVELADFLLAHPQLGQKPVAFVSVNSEEINTPLPRFSAEQNVTHIVRDLDVDTVVILREIKENKTFVRVLFEAIPLGVGVVEFPRFYEMLTGKIPLSLIGEIWFLENLVGIKKNFYEFFKRGLDIVVALILLVPAALLSPFIALAVRVDSSGPVFYRQKRVGRNGREFWAVKYRSMIKNAEVMSGYKGVGPDPRHTRVGKVLRKSYLDELPQIINILKGEMSFVGPRPERPEYISELKQKIPFYEMRLLTQPGITGWAQINMENDASVEDAPEKMQYDLYYIKNRSLILDILVILKTIFIILRREGR